MLVGILGRAGTATALLIAVGIVLQAMRYYKRQRFEATTELWVPVVLNYMAWAAYGWVSRDVWLMTVHTTGSLLSMFIVVQFIQFQFVFSVKEKPEKSKKKLYLAFGAAVATLAVCLNVAITGVIFNVSQMKPLAGTIGTITGACIVWGFITQIIGNYQNKRSGLDAPVLFPALVNYIIWASYGFLKPDLFLQIVHTANFFSAIVLVYQYFHYRRTSK